METCILKSNSTRRAELRAKHDGKLPCPEITPARPFASRNGKSRHNEITTWYGPQGPEGYEIARLIHYRPAGNYGFSIKLNSAILGDTPRAAYTAAYRALRLAKHDPAKLLHTIQHQHELILELAIDAVQSADALSIQAEVSRTQRRRALLIARARGPKVARPVAAPSAAVTPPEPLWSDPHVIRYICAAFPRLTPERQAEIAAPLLREIISGQRNSVWSLIVHEYQAAQDEAMQAVKS